MSIEPKSYVVRTASGGLRVAGSRVSLDSVVHDYREGFSAEQILADFPTLTLESIHGAIAYYLGHPAEMEEYFRAQAVLWEELKRECEEKNADLLQRLRTRRAEKAAGP